MIELRKALNAQLKTVHPRVYFQVAPELADFPYLTFEFITTDDGEGQELAIIDVDGWDINPDTTTLETLMTALNTAINKRVISSGNMTATLFLDRKIPLIDDDPLIKRRKYIYQARMHKKG